MKVLQINAVSGLYSTGRNSVELADYLNNNGHEGYIAYSIGLPYYKGYKIGNKIDAKIHALFSRVFGLQGYYSARSTIKLLKFISNLKPDIIHLGNLHSNFINIEILLKYIAKENIPTVITLHDCWFYTGKCTHYTIDKCYKWQKNCGNCPRLKKDIPSWFFDRTKKMLNDKKELFSKIPKLAVVGVSDWITNEAKQSFLSSAKILTRIYNWIDLDIFKPADGLEIRKKLRIENKFVILGVAASWSNDKGLNKFIELSDKLKGDTQIVLVGEISDKVALPSSIIYVPKTHNAEELAQLYSMADVFLHLSLEESFGKVIAEAISCGTPAIVLNSTACPEIIDSSCGIVLENYNINDIVESINTIKSKNKSFYSTSTIKRAEQKFNSQLILSDYIGLYNYLICHNNS